MIDEEKPQAINSKPKKITAVGVIKAVVWFIATAAGSVWVSTFISGCGL